MSSKRKEPFKVAGYLCVPQRRANSRNDFSAVNLNIAQMLSHERGTPLLGEIVEEPAIAGRPGFRVPCLKSRDLCLVKSSWPDDRAKTSSSSLSAHSIYLPSYAAYPRSDTFFWNFVHERRFLCKTIFIFATLGRISDCRKCDHTLLAPDLKSEQGRILAIFPLSSQLCIPVSESRKN